MGHDLSGQHLSSAALTNQRSGASRRASAYKIDQLRAPASCRQRALGISPGLSFTGKGGWWLVSRPDASYFFSGLRREGASDFSLLAQRKVTKRKGAPVTRLFPPRQHALVGRLVRASLREQASIGLPVRLPESARCRGGAGEGGEEEPDGSSGCARHRLGIEFSGACA